MIHRHSDRAPGPGLSPAAPGASRERSEAQQPTARPERSVFGRPVSTVGASAESVPQIGEGSALPEKQDTMDRSRLARNLPTLVLEKIFSYLPSHALSQCARVCRHWHTCLPALQTRIALWLQEHPLPCPADSQLGRGFSSRTQPFLQDGNSPFLYPLAQLQQLQQEQQEQQAQQAQQAHRAAAVRQDTAQGSQPSTVCNLQSSLVCAALHHQLSLTPELRLRPAPLDWPAAAQFKSELVGFAFSSCSRWLAISCHLQTHPCAHLRLYGWENGVWQRCWQVLPEPYPHVNHLQFTPMPPDTLLGIRGVYVLAWSKEPGSHTWHGTLVCSTPQSYQIVALYSMANGDQIILTQSSREELVFPLALFCRRTRDGRSWNTIRTVSLEPPNRDLRSAYCWAGNRQSCQLALATSRRQGNIGPVTNEIDIWHTGLNSSRPEPWKCQHAVLPCHNSSLTKLAYSPGGHYLLGVLSDSQVRLWKLDAQHRLQEQLVVPSCHYLLARNLKQQAAFRSDGKQLALSSSPWQIQIFYCDADDRWQYGPQLEIQPAPDLPANDSLKYMRLSSTGRILARKTEHQVDIWHQDPVEGWRHVVQHQWTPGQQHTPQFCLPQPGDLVCTSVENPELSLQVYGPDSRGKLVIKNCMPITVNINGPDAASPDGLSLLLGSTQRLPVPLQLVAAQDDQKHHGYRQP